MERLTTLVERARKSPVDGGLGEWIDRDHPGATPRFADTGTGGMPGFEIPGMPGANIGVLNNAAPEVLAWELRHLFAGTWSCLGRLDELFDAYRADGIEFDVRLARCGPVQRSSRATRDDPRAGAAVLEIPVGSGAPPAAHHANALPPLPHAKHMPGSRR